MSKAFTKEQDGDADEGVEDAPLLLPEGAKNYMTPKGAEAQRKEYESLQSEKTQKSGDMSPQGKERLRAIGRRLRSLQKRLELVEIIDPRSQSTDRVLFGAVVTVLDEAGIARDYAIVGIDEADPENGRISWISPLARTLLNRRVGDSVTFQTPKGEEDLEIAAIRYL